MGLAFLFLLLALLNAVQTRGLVLPSDLHYKLAVHMSLHCSAPENVEVI